MSVTSESVVGAVSEVGDVSKPALPYKNWAQIVWDFSRPHTIIGSVLSVISLHLFAITAPGTAMLNISALGVALAWAIACAVLVNIFVTGLNQIYDVEIDKINKPYLPIAAGYLSLPAAWTICLVSLLLGIVPSMIAYPFDKAPLLAVTVGSALLGTAYSAPPLRLKRFPLFAALCIIVVRGTLINLGFYAHAAQAVGGALFPPRACLAALFFGLFGCVIAVVKDVPDVGGDRKFEIKTLSVRLGAATVMGWGTRLLSTTLALAAASCVYGALTTSSAAVSIARFCVAAAALASVLWVERSSAVLLQGKGAGGGSLAIEEEDAFSKDAFNYYMDLWKLFYGAYLLLPFAL